MTCKLLGTFALVFAISAQAGPFGLEMGMSQEQIASITKLKKEKPVFGWSTASLPKGMNEFEDYRLIITPQDGLCKISAFTGSISTDRYGDSAKRQFKEIESLLEQKYGKGERFDKLRGGSIWNEARDWTTGLIKEERMLKTFWLNPKGYSENIHSIALHTSGLDVESVMIRITYEFNNIDSCIAYAKSQKSANL